MKTGHATVHRSIDRTDLIPPSPPSKGGDWCLHFSQLRHQASQTPSPNSGWPMAAFALRLGVHLDKPGVYVLNAKGADVTAETATAGIIWVTRAGWAVVLLFALLGVLRFELVSVW